MDGNYEGYKVTDRAFRGTHRRKRDGVIAMLRADRDGIALYDWENKNHNGSFINYNCHCKSERFHREFAEL